MKSLLKIRKSWFSSLNCDILISGAGVHGCSLALALNQTYVKPEIIVLENESKMEGEGNRPSNVPGYDATVLNASTFKFLRSLGAFPFVDMSKCTEITETVVWEAQGSNFFKIQNRNANQAFSTEASNIEKTLRRSLSEMENVKFLTPASIKSLSSTQHSASVSVSTGESLECQLVVGTDGSNSSVKKAAKISSYGWHHSQYCITCTVKAEDIEEGKRVWQRHLPSGPISLLPLWDSYYSLKWTVSLDEHSHLMKLSNEEFVSAVNKLLNKNSDFPFIGVNFAGEMPIPPLVKSLENERISEIISNLQASVYATNRVALIGDAAQSIHQFADQGLNMGMIHSALLANQLTKSLKAGNDLGEEMFLNAFSTNAKVKSYKMSMAIEGIKSIYSVENGPFPFLRNLLVGGLNNFDSAKEKAFEFSSGKYFEEPFEWEKTL